MKNFAITNLSGEPLDLILGCPEEMYSYCEVPPNSRVIMEIPNTISVRDLLKRFYWKDVWKQRQEQPSEFHYWDSVAELWTPNVGQAIRARKDAVNALRDEKLNSNPNGVLYSGYTFANDSKTRTNISEVLNLLNAGVPIPEGFVFRTADDIDVPFTADDVKGLATLILFYKNSCYQASWNIKAQIEALTTVEEVEAFDITIGWPA